MPEPEDPADVDAAIRAVLERTTDQAWAELWAAVDRLATTTTSHATWAGGDVVGSTVVEGEERPVIQMPYPVYAEPVEAVRQAIGAAGLIVPFDWMHWDDLQRYRGPSALADAPVTDAVRMLTAIVRSERFTDGSLEGALTEGTVQAALARIRRWHEERPG